MPKLSANLTGALIALTAFGIFASHDALIKLIAVRYSPIQINFSMAFFSAPILLVAAALDRSGGGLWPKKPLLVFVRSLLLTSAGTLAFTAFKILPLAQVYALLFSTPLLITILAGPLLGEKIGPRRWAAVCVGLIGVLIVLRPWGGEIGWGHLVALGSAASSAVGTTILRRVGPGEKPLTMLVAAMLTITICMGAALPAVYRPLEGADMALLLCLAVMSVAAQFGVVIAYRRAEAVVIAPLQYSQILWAIAYGILIFGETPDLWTLTGASIVMASGFYIVWREARVRKTADR